MIVKGTNSIDTNYTYKEYNRTIPTIPSHGIPFMWAIPTIPSYHMVFHLCLHCMMITMHTRVLTPWCDGNMVGYKHLNMFKLHPL